MPAQPINTVRAFIEAINRRSASDMSALMTEDHTFVDSAGRVVSAGATMTAGWHHWFRMFPDYQMQVERMFAQESVVAVFGSAAGTYNGKRGLVPQNRIEMPAAWKAVVENGKIKLWQVYADWTEGCRIIDEDEKSDGLRGQA
jgi:predicted ester cyclase